MQFLTIKNYEHFQHYKNRRPVWIKLYTALLDDYEFEALPDASKAHLMMMWILASKTDNRIPWDEKWLAKKMGATTRVDVQVLIDHGFVAVLAECYQDASKMLAHFDDPASLEKRREEKSKSVASATTASAEKPKVEEPEVEEIIAHYLTLHPLRRPGARDRGFVRGRLKTHTSAEIRAAIDGNASDQWHKEKGKHELEYILRDSKIDDFRLRPAPRDWSKERLIGNDGLPTKAMLEWEAAGMPT